MDDAAGGLYEHATFCKGGNDDKVPTQVAASDFSTLAICPAPGGCISDGECPSGTCTNNVCTDAGPVTGAVPGAWYVRVMFDELLDPDVEDLEPVDPMNPDTIYFGTLARTQPVILTCGGTPVPYDGYYAPNGNNVTWPLGPSLVVIPDDSTTIATSTGCEITLKDTITDKDSEPVPPDQRGPFDFSVAPLEIIGSDPEPGGAELGDPTAPIAIFFNVDLDAATVTGGTDVVTTGPTAGVVSVAGTDILVDPAGGTWAAGTYTVTIPTTATITDSRGGALMLAADYVIDFTVAP